MKATRKNHSGKGSSSDAAVNFAPVVDRVAAGAHEAVDKAAGAATLAAMGVAVAAGVALNFLLSRR